MTRSCTLVLLNFISDVFKHQSAQIWLSRDEVWKKADYLYWFNDLTDRHPTNGLIHLLICVLLLSTPAVKTRLGRGVTIKHKNICFPNACCDFLWRRVIFYTAALVTHGSAGCMLYSLSGKNLLWPFVTQQVKVCRFQLILNWNCEHYLLWTRLCVQH